MRTMLYPGSFDPVTLGHMDVIARASRAFERVIIGVLYNEKKPVGAFTVDQRLRMLREVTAMYPNVEAAAFSGLLVGAVRMCGADGVLRGIRTTADVEDELQMARLNLMMAGVETVFFAASPEVSHISASRVREIARLGGEIRGLVPDAIIGQILGVMGAASKA